MEKRDIGTVLEQAMSLDGRGDRKQALELCRRVLAQIGEDDPRREEIESAIAYLEACSVHAIEPAQMTDRPNVTGWSQKRGLARWSVLALTLLFGLGMLIVSTEAGFQGNSDAVGVLRMDAPVPGVPMPETDGPQLALAPTPLALAPTAIVTATLKPTPTPTLVPAPTPTSSATMIPPTMPAPSKLSGGGQGANPAAPSSTPAGVPSAPPAPSLAPQPGTTPQPDPSPQPDPGDDGGGGDKGGGNGGGGEDGNGDDDGGKGGNGDDDGGGKEKGGDDGGGKGKEGDDGGGDDDGDDEGDDDGDDDGGGKGKNIVGSLLDAVVCALACY